MSFYLRLVCLKIGYPQDQWFLDPNHFGELPQASRTPPAIWFQLGRPQGCVPEWDQHSRDLPMVPWKQTKQTSKTTGFPWVFSETSWWLGQVGSIFPSGRGRRRQRWQRWQRGGGQCGSSSSPSEGQGGVTDLVGDHGGSFAQTGSD